MSDFRPLPIRRPPTSQGGKTAESKYWSKFKSPVLVKEFASVTSVHFSPSAPHDFAVTSSARVQIYNHSTHVVKKTVSRFKDVAYSGTIRNDGKLLIAGDAAGTVQMFDLGSRAILRTFLGHKDAVKVTKFSGNLSHVLSASDDKTVRVWDIPSQEAIHIFDDHTDHVRSALVSDENPHMIVSGSYDHTVRLWDIRANQCVMKMDHGTPVESVIFLPGTSMIASAGSNRVKIWNLLGGGSLFQNLCNHQKTITALTLDGSKTRIITGSLDHHVKIYSLSDYKVTYNIKYPSPILSVGVSPSNSHLVVGMTTGLLSIRHRVLKTEDIAKAQSRQEELKGGTYKYYQRGSSYKPSETDIKVEVRRRKKLKGYDKLLRSFQYGKALDSVLETKQSPLVIVSLLEELMYRNGLNVALGGRDDIGLEPIARFLVKHLPNPRYIKVLLVVANMILDMYSKVIGQSTIIDELFIKLKRKIHGELELHEKLLECLGMLECVLSSSQRLGVSAV
ncbi:snoRNA-binding rRNA-processing protein [Phlyctochytrium planicorne]|nr:snoRNA-binding rRNA-processing protein [Phlyctochytrium planicorne]